MDERELQEIYNRLGTDRVLDELDIKFGRKPQQSVELTSIPEKSSPMADDDMFAEIEARNKRKLSKIEGAQEVQEVYSAQELSQLFELRRRLLKIPDSKPASKLAEIEKVLDSKRFWAYKFSTQPGSGDIKDLKTSPQDSLYYVTPRGLSLRVKRVLAYEPEKDESLVYPVFEKAVFRNDGEEDYLITPQLGAWTGEFASSDFLSLQRGGNELTKVYHSKLRFYEKNGKIVGVGSELANEDPYHNGDRVNRVYDI